MNLDRVDWASAKTASPPQRHPEGVPVLNGWKGNEPLRAVLGSARQITSHKECHTNRHYQLRYQPIGAHGGIPLVRRSDLSACCHFESEAECRQILSRMVIRIGELRNAEIVRADFGAL